MAFFLPLFIVLFSANAAFGQNMQLVFDEEERPLELTVELIDAALNLSFSGTRAQILVENPNKTSYAYDVQYNKGAKSLILKEKLQPVKRALGKLFHQPKVRVILPQASENSSIFLKTVNGSITVDGNSVHLLRDIETSLTNGSVVIKNMGGALFSHKSVNGALETENISFNAFSLQSVNGDFTLNLPISPAGIDVKFEKASGSLYFNGQAQALTTESKNRRLLLAAPQEPSTVYTVINAKTVNGNLRINAPQPS